MKKKKEWGYGMDDDEMDHLMNALTKAYKDTYLVTKDDYDWDDMVEAAETKPRYDHIALS